MDISIIGQRNYTIINSSGGGPNNIGGTHIERIKKVFYIKRYPLLVQSTLGVGIMVMPHVLPPQSIDSIEREVL
ncbi:unnamed protein product [Adineta steineri]|uniref:Uncharacterized protein n=1 Tax=Adineta steineri TaxID=433720 RepID=A0A820HYQ0_9BILA|nr:unnamed protein product [Adineta steineri]